MQRGPQPEHVKSKRSRRARKSAEGAVSAHNVNLSCWNRQHGCTFTGDSTSLAQHLEQECRFHETTCAVCHARILLMDIAMHLRQDCCRSAKGASGIAAASESAPSTSRLLSTATVSPGNSPLTVRDVDRAFAELKEMFAALTAHQIAVVETKVNELSEAVASLGAKSVDVDEREPSDDSSGSDESDEIDTTDTTENEILDSVVAKIGDMSQEIATLRTAVLQSTDTAVEMTATLHEQLRRCAQREHFNSVLWKLDELTQIVSRDYARLMRNTADTRDRCQLLAKESTLYDLHGQLERLLENVRSSQFKSSIGIALILALVFFGIPALLKECKALNPV